MMKAGRKIIALLVAYGLLLAGCGTVEWDVSASPQAEEGQEESSPPALPIREETGTEPVIEGGYTLLRPEAIPPGDAALLNAFQAGDAVAILWGGGSGRALETMDPATGESLTGEVLRSGAYGAEAVPEEPGRLRIAYADSVEYRSAAAPGEPEIHALPESVTSAIWRGYPGSAPYDIIPEGSIVYMGQDGIYLAGAAGSGAEKLLDNAAIPDWLGYWGLDGRGYEAAKLHYVAPRLMNGGKHVAATACYIGEDGSVCLGVVSVEVVSRSTTYFPDLIAEGEAPASPVSGDVLYAKGEYGDVLITLSTGEAGLIPYDDLPDERHSSDFATFARFDRTEYADGYLEHSLVTHPLGLPEEATGLLTLGGYPRAEIAAMTEDYILVEAEDPAGGTAYLAVRLP